MTSPSLMLSFRRADVTAFWIIVVAAAIAAAALMARVLDASILWAASGAAILALGAVSKYRFDLGIVAWNKLVSIALPPLRAYVLKVCYYVMFGAIRFAGSSLDRSVADRGRLESSRWLRRSEERPSGRWLICLQPVMLLLTALGDQRPQGGPPSGTYTLY
jgi:hypothetical protein